MNGISEREKVFGPRNRPQDVLRAAMMWYESHISGGYGQDDLGGDLLCLFATCAVFKAETSAEERANHHVYK